MCILLTKSPFEFKVDLNKNIRRHFFYGSKLYTIENRGVVTNRDKRLGYNSSAKITIPFEAIRADTKYTLARESGLEEEVSP